MTRVNTKTYFVGDLVIEIDNNACISCGTCQALAPDVFELDKKLMCQVKNGAKANRKTVMAAAESCVVEAITIIDKKTGKKLIPKY